MLSKRICVEKYSHVNIVGFSRGTLIRCCFIPDCLLIKLEVSVLVFRKGGNLEKQEHGH